MAAAAAVVVLSPAICDAAHEAGYFSGYAALPFLSSQRLASNNLQRLAALQSPHVLSWHSMVRRRVPHAAAYGGTHAAWAMQTEAMARSRREGSACSGVHARL